MKTCHSIARMFLHALPLLLFAAQPAWSQTPPEIPPAFGPHVNLQPKDFAGSKSFTSRDRIAGTYYFYWYDIYTKGHIVDPEDGSDALTTHPKTLEDFSYKSVRWHKQQLNDMIAGGIDVALPVFWGAPSEQGSGAALHWSYAGLPPLVQAREELLREGKRPPRIGLFYDTSTLQCNEWNRHIDLTTDYGKRWFYATIRDFFSCIPPKHWAMIDGKPIVLLYASAFAKKWDQDFIDYTKAEFLKEFGGRVPWIAPQDSWGVKGDSTCAWGGALGLRNPGIGELGPGYDDSAVYGRKPLVANREGGKFYEEQWLKFLRRPSNFVMIETWSEFHEGTDICESKEYGRQYIELTRKYADLFKRGWRPPWPEGKYTRARAVSAILGRQNQEAGLRLVECEDGRTEPVAAAGNDARVCKPAPGKSCYFYFSADDSFKWAGAMDATVEVEYFDAAPGALLLEFDGSDTAAPQQGAYSRSAQTVELKGGHTWRKAEFKLRGARFSQGQNGGSDFRLVVQSPNLPVRKVVLRRG